MSLNYTIFGFWRVGTGSRVWFNEDLEIRIIRLMRSEVIEQGALSYWLLVERSPAVKRRDCFRDPDDSAWALIAPNYQHLIPSKKSNNYRFWKKNTENYNFCIKTTQFNLISGLTLTFWDSESLLSSHRKRPSGTDFLIFISEENLIVIGCYFSHNKAGKLISSRFSGFSGIRNFVIIDKDIQTVFEIRKPRTAYI